MEIVLRKKDPMYIATVMALTADPMPYTISNYHNDPSTVLIVIAEDVPAERLYRMGLQTGHFFKIVTGVLKAYNDGRHGWLKM